MNSLNNIVYIGIGSNLGDKRNFCLKAIECLKNHPQIQIEKTSSFYQSEPLGPLNQDWFVNAVIKIKTSLTPQNLLDVLQKVEKQFFRKRDIPWGPRTIDLDILFFNREIIQNENLQIPHPQAHNRSFVLIPLMEIAPHFTHPVTQKTAFDLLRNLDHYSHCLPLISNQQRTPFSGDLS